MYKYPQDAEHKEENVINRHKAEETVGTRLSLAKRPRVSKHGHVTETEATLRTQPTNNPHRYIQVRTLIYTDSGKGSLLPDDKVFLCEEMQAETTLCP